MKVVLMTDVPNLGPKGKVLTVADGNARNYLLARHLAADATAGAVHEVEAAARAARLRQDRAHAEAEALRERIAGVRLEIAKQVGQGGRLFGSVTAADIARELAGRGIAVDRRRIVLEAPLRNLGEYQVAIRLHPEVTAQVLVEVKPA